MLLKIPLSWSFLRRAQPGQTSENLTEVSEPEIKSGLRLSLKKMFMSDWEDCMCDGDYSSLNDDIDLWIDLVSEYQELRGDTIDAVEVLRLTKEIRGLSFHLYLFGLCATQLEKKYSEGIADSMNKLGYQFTPKVKDASDEDYQKQLKICISKSKKKYVELQMAIKQLEVAKPNVKKPTREYYEETLINIEQYQRTQYSMDSLTVYKFVILEKRLVNAVMKQKHGRSNNR